jgi:isopentenyl-diphosphate Delta-isomerase
VAELIEVYTEAGTATGLVKSRAAIHADGDWHVAAFLWVFDERGRIVLQERSPDKDVWPGRWDASAAGHVQAGEPIEDAARRELAEELGLEVSLAELLRDAPHREERRHANGMIDREHHAVFFVRADRPLDTYRPGPEVTAIAFVEAEALGAFARRERDSLPAVRETGPCVLRPDDLVVYDPEYLARVAERVLSFTRS